MKTFIVNNDVCVKSSNNKNKIMKYLFISLIPIILFTFFKNGIMPFLKGNNNFFELLYPIIFILLGGFTSLFFQFIYNKLALSKKHFNINYEQVIPGILLSLVLPIKTPLYLLVLGIIVLNIIDKIMFKIFKKNIFNPVLIGYLFLFVVFNNNFSSINYFNNYESLNLINKLPFLNLIDMNFVGSYNEIVLPYGSLWDMFFGFKPGSNGEISILILLISFIYLVYKKSIKYRITITYILTVFIMSALIGLFNNMNIWYSIFSIINGTLFFAAIYIATDFKTSPVTKTGQLIYAFLLGILTILLRYCLMIINPFFIAILMMNLFVYILDRFGALCSLNRLKTVIASVICLIVLLGSTYFVSINLKPAENIKTDLNFKIISKIQSNSFVYYIVSEKCQNIVKSKITINKEGKIIDILILENSEPQYAIIENEEYINKLIKYQNNLNDLNDIKIAFKTTSGLKKMIRNVLIDYNK